MAVRKLTLGAHVDVYGFGLLPKDLMCLFRIDLFDAHGSLLLYEEDFVFLTVVELITNYKLSGISNPTYFKSCSIVRGNLNPMAVTQPRICASVKGISSMFSPMRSL